MDEDAKIREDKQAQFDRMTRTFSPTYITESSELLGIVYDKNKDSLYAGSIANAGVFRDYEMDASKFKDMHDALDRFLDYLNAETWNKSYDKKEDMEAGIVSEPKAGYGKEKSMESRLLDQFNQMKEKHPDAILLFRVGDFYETYKQDAVKASKDLDIPKTTRKMSDGSTIDLLGFPHHALDTYLPKLVRAGNRVAICEQLEDPKKLKKDNSNTVNQTDMPKKKKEEATQEKPSKSAKNAAEEKPATEKKKESKAEVKAESKAEAKAEVKSESKTEKKSEAKTEQKPEAKTEQKADATQERKPREPQMVTVNGDKVTHGHAFQGKDTQDWYFTAKLNGEQLKPQKMDAADIAAYSKKEITVPQLMEKYYPTKLMEKVPDLAFKFPNGIAGPEGALTVNKFNVYKEKDEQRPDFGKYKFYAEVAKADLKQEQAAFGEKKLPEVMKMSAVASRQDLNAYFDRVMTPGQLVEKNFGERLHLKSAYEKYQLPEGVDPQGVRVAKDRADGKWKVSVDMGEAGRTSKKEISFDDGFSLFKTKTATREQIAAKYLGEEISNKLGAPSLKAEKRPVIKF